MPTKIKLKKKISDPSSGQWFKLGGIKFKIIEVLSYGCPDCYRIEFKTRSEIIEEKAKPSKQLKKLMREKSVLEK